MFGYICRSGRRPTNKIWPIDKHRSDKTRNEDNDKVSTRRSAAAFTVTILPGFRLWFIFNCYLQLQYSMPHSKPT